MRDEKRPANSLKKNPSTEKRLHIEWLSRKKKNQLMILIPWTFPRNDLQHLPRRHNSMDFFQEMICSSTCQEDMNMNYYEQIQPLTSS